MNPLDRRAVARLISHVFGCQAGPGAAFVVAGLGLAYERLDAPLADAVVALL
jgi:hypothetical protein